jgi:adenylate cyclase
VAGLIARARVDRTAGQTEGAESAARAALAELESLGGVTRAGRVRLLLAEILLAQGRRGDAEAELRRQLTDSREHGLKLLERKAREALAALGVLVDDPDLPAIPERPDEVPTEIGERLVTVLFADVRGYTAMTGATAPAEMLDKISAYQRWAAQEVERHLGTVDKFAGDAVMATFNISGAQVDHVQHALAAARALRDKAALLGLAVGVGIATGAAIVGRLKDGANVSVLGTTTNLAARLQAQAGAGEILLSEEAYRRLGDVEAEPEQFELKGFAAPVRAYRLRS